MMPALLHDSSMMSAVSHEKFPARPGLIYMGTPEFAIPPLQALITRGHEILAVVTQPDRPKGRGRKLTAPPVKRLALERGIEVFQPEKASERDFCDLIGQKGPDLIIVVAFGQILKKRLLDIPRWGAVNIHASLLPKYRGASPIQRAILDNESKTGLTVMRMDEGLDTGPVLYQKEVAIQEDETAGHLHDRLSLLAADFIIEALTQMAGGQIREIPQEHGLATYAPKIKRGDALIDWNRSARSISSLIRALDPSPGAMTLLEGKEIKVFSSRVVDERRRGGVPGRVIAGMDGGLCVETGEGVVEIRAIQYPGKRRVSASDFLRGFRLPEGTVLG